MRSFERTNEFTVHLRVQATVLPFGPCSFANITTECFATANDIEDGDLSFAITVQDVTCETEAEDSGCLACSVTALEQGLCLPGTYLFR